MYAGGLIIALKGHKIHAPQHCFKIALKSSPVYLGVRAFVVLACKIIQEHQLFFDCQL